jgi:AraC family transcriptional regulator, regulatory protein of adaptative response / methylated-DNA-[protein]-cysteine methyltransferase
MPSIAKELNMSISMKAESNFPSVVKSVENHAASPPEKTNAVHDRETIRFTVGDSSLGRVLVAATAKGVCAILLADDADALLRNLEERFPKAQLIQSDAHLQPTVGKVVAFIEAPAAGLDLPLDLRGTPFQQRVWQALREIPAGSTASYAEIAERIGAPKEAYAVGEACASNPIALAVPCHRVVRKNGALAGYRWGFKRKRALLVREAAAGSGLPLFQEIGPANDRDA